MNPGRGRLVESGRKTVTTAPSRSAGTLVASATVTGSISRPLASRERMTVWLRSGAWDAGRAQMPDRSIGAAASRPSPAAAARVRASAGSRSSAEVSSAPNPAHDEGPPASTAVLASGSATADGSEEGPRRRVAGAADDAAERRWTAGERGGAALGTAGSVPDEIAGAVTARTFFSAA